MSEAEKKQRKAINDSHNSRGDHITTRINTRVNYYQTNKKISSLLIESSTLQSNYQLEISTLEGITKQVQTEIMSKKN